MAKAEYAVVDGKTRKIKKKYAVVDGKTKKIKKEYAVVGGKTRLCWSGFTPKYLAFTRGAVTGYSEDGVSWNEGSILSTATNSCTFCFGKYFYADTGGNVHYSEDGITWTLSRTFAKTIYLLRYCDDGYLYAFGTVTSSSDWIWRTKDGVTWEGFTLNLSTFIADSRGYAPLDFRYGVVGGTAAYYFLFEHVAGVFKVESMSGGTFTRLYKEWNPSKGALYICEGVIYVVEVENDGNSSNVYYYTTGSVIKLFQASGTICRVIGTSGGLLIVTYGQVVYLVSDKKYVQQSTTYPTIISSYERYCIFACAWNGKNRIVIIDRSNASVSTLRCIYTDDYGVTWNRIDASMNNSFTISCGCYGIDGGGYYSE